jgi:hypothetical protein
MKKPAIKPRNFVVVALRSGKFRPAVIEDKRRKQQARPKHRKPIDQHI